MIYIILIVAAILRLINLNQSFWMDEAITATIARDLSISDIFTQYLPLDNHPPLYLLLINFLFSFLSNTETVARLPSVIFGVLTIYIIFSLTRQLINKKVAILTTAFLATSPLHIYYSQEARMYSLNTFLIAIIMWVFIMYLKTKNKILLIPYTLVSVILLYTDYLPYLIFIVTNLLIILFRRVNRFWIISQLILTLSFLPLLPLFTKQFFLGVGARGVSDLFDLILGKFSYKSLPLTFEKFVLGRIPVPEDLSIFLILIPIIIFLVVLIMGILKSAKNEKIILISWLSIPLAAGLTLSLFIPVYQYFRFLFVLPPFYILIASGLFYFQKKHRLVLIVTLLAINVVSTLVYFTDPRLQREQWRQATAWTVENTRGGKVLFVSSDPFAPYLWYQKDHPEAAGAFLGFYSNQSDKDRLDKILKLQNRILVFTYLQDITNPQRNLQGWIREAGFRKTGLESFIGVGEIEIYVR